jgi:hypothetical protein
MSSTIDRDLSLGGPSLCQTGKNAGMAHCPAARAQFEAVAFVGNRAERSGSSISSALSCV